MVISKTKAIILLSFIAVAALAATAMVLLPGPDFGAEPVEFNIKEGQTLDTTARLLAGRGFIRDRYIFSGYAILTGNEKKFQAGKYLIRPGASIHQLVMQFSRGLAETDLSITIPEGTNLADVDRIFAEAGLIKSGELIIFSKKLSSWPEGFLFPDTYRFRELDDGDFLMPQEIVQKMRDNFENKTREVFAGRFTGEGGADRGYRTIIVASILEKEVRTEKDMRLVAGIIEKRLEIGMPLQIDATVAYGVCLPKLLAGRYCDVSQANLVDNIPIDTAYNTYRRKDLPVGPISNPGLAALRAALNPQASDYFYYLSAKDGTTIFSKTGAEHEAARRKYLQNNI